MTIYRDGVATEYAFLRGRSGGQELIGGTDASDGLTLTSTSDATKGKVSISGDLFDITQTAIGATQGDYGLALVNTTAAAHDSQQFSPPIRWRGYGWKTDATAASQSVDFRAFVRPIQGAAAPTGALDFQYSINGAAYSNLLTVLSSGLVLEGTAPIGISLDAGGSGNVAFKQGGGVTILDATTNLDFRFNGTAMMRIEVSGGLVLGSSYVGTDPGTGSMIISGNVGIGTTGPDRLFHAEVSDAVTNAVTYAQRLSHITSATAVSGFGTGIEFELEENDASNRVAAFITADWEDAGETASADGRLNFGVMTADAAAATAMSIWNGNVGIGTTSPGAKLHVSGGYLLLDNNQIIQFKDSGGAAQNVIVGGSDDVLKFSPLKATGDIIFRNWAGGTNVVIQQGGNVGIGTTPLAKLHIDQASTTAAIPVLSLDQADESDGFINFIGTSAASAVGPISTWTGGAAIEGYVRVEINGVQKWMPYCADPTV